MSRPPWLLVGFLLTLQFLACMTLAQSSSTSFLLNDWSLISSSNTSANGEQISTPGFSANDWLSVQVPCTVMAGLIQNGFYPDVFYSDNLQLVDLGQFNYSWWYRTQFNITQALDSKVVRVTFKGINYRANVWFNGALIANSSQVVGTFRYFEFDLTNLIEANSENALAVEVFKPNDFVFPPNNNSTDLAITFVDWAPFPPDSNMGLWQDVMISITGGISLDYPMVVTTLTNDNTIADLTVAVEVQNWNTSSESVTGTLVGSIIELGIQFEQAITFGPGEVRDVFFSSSAFPQLVFNVVDDMLWWPWQMGAQTQYTLNLTFIDATQRVSDNLEASFGIREATSSVNANGHRLYAVNGRPILIRGAGWSPDLFQRASPQRQLQEFDYVLDMNLNAIRLEGKFENDNFFDLADVFGILTMPGFCCCDAWQHWSAWTDEQFLVSAESLRSQTKRLRIHPSVLVFLYSSDELPPLAVEDNYLSVFDDVSWPNPTLSTASNYTSPVTGPSGVKMSGPYSWVAPNYWLEDTHYGGAFGFLTEGGPGENPLTYEAFSNTIPASDSWPINEFWDYHCGNPEGNFGSLDYFTPALSARYGTPTSAEDYLQKAQLMAYEGHRAMFEGYSRNKYESTGVIQWMLNNAWPGMIWHLYDYYLTPSASYFGTKKACEPVHVIYSYDDPATIYVVTSLYDVAYPYVSLDIEVFDVMGIKIYDASTGGGPLSGDQSFLITANPLPPLNTIQGITSTYFLRLTVSDLDDDVLSQNLYWLSTTPDVIDFANTTWFRTPDSTYANFTLLQTLPPVYVNTYLTYTSDQTSGITTVSVLVTNDNPCIAFFIRLRLTAGADGQEILPILWSDNYITLMADESTDISATFETELLGQYEPALLVEVYNNISGKGKNLKSTRTEN